MHEMSVAQALVRQVRELLPQPLPIRRIALRIGPLSGVVPALLIEAFPLAAAGTPAEHAVLDIEQAPVRVRCETCGAESEAAANKLVCGVCGDWHTQLISGDELLLVDVTYEANHAHIG